MRNQDYSREIIKNPLLTKEQERELGIRTKAGDMEARKKMILANLRLVFSIMNDYTRQNSSDFEDVVQGGIEGLITAVDKFDPDRGVPFSSYAANWIKKEGLKYLIRRNGTIKKDPKNIAIMNKIKRFYSIYYTQYGKEPSYKEILEKLFEKNFPRSQDLENLEEEIKSLILDEKILNVVSLDSQISKNEKSLTTIDKIFYEDKFGKQIEEESEAEEILKHIDDIAPLERVILYLHFYEENTFEEIGRKLGGLTKGAIAKKYYRALRILRNSIKDNKIFQERYQKYKK